MMSDLRMKWRFVELIKSVQQSEIDVLTSTGKQLRQVTQE